MLKKYMLLNNNYDLKNEAIFPYVLLFPYNKEIKPKITLLVKYRKLDIPLTTVFSLNKQDFCNKLNFQETEYDEICLQKEVNVSPQSLYYLNEMDLMFRYSRYPLL